MAQDVFYGKPDKNGIIEVEVLNGLKMEYRTAVNLRQFYGDLYDYFMKNAEVQIYDSMGTKGEKAMGDFFDFQNKEGEFVDDKGNHNRHGDFYEKEFIWAKNDGSVEFELKWEGKAKTPNSPYGWFEISIDLVNRAIVDIEVEKNGQKQKLQNGTWEFRNKIVYKNNIIPKYLKTVPFVKNSDMLQNLYMQNIHLKEIERDFEWCLTKIKAPFIAFIESYFRTG